MFIAILDMEQFLGDDTWSVLRHSNLAPISYVDIVWVDDIIFAVSDDGSVFTWHPFEYGEFSTKL